MSKNIRSVRVLNFGQEREMTKSKGLWRTGAHGGEFFILVLNLNATATNSVQG